MATLVALLGGGVAALGHAPFHLWFLALPGFAAIVWAVSVATTARKAFWAGWIAGAAYFAVTLHWIVEPFLVDAEHHIEGRNLLLDHTPFVYAPSTFE